MNEKLGLRGDASLASQMAEKLAIHLQGLWESENEFLNEKELDAIDVELDKVFVAGDKSKLLVARFRKIVDARK